MRHERALVHVCPAPAGMSPGLGQPGKPVVSLPRTRGDEPKQARESYKALESAPHPRG